MAIATALLATLAVSRAPTCTLQPAGSCFAANDANVLATVNVADKDECCRLCSKAMNCQGWTSTWNPYSSLLGCSLLKTATRPTPPKPAPAKCDVKAWNKLCPPTAADCSTCNEAHADDLSKMGCIGVGVWKQHCAAASESNCSSGVVTPSSRPKPLNFIFVFPDTLRAESHGGYVDSDHPTPRNVTPHLDAFAKTGTRFHQAHVMHTQCSPSRCTMLTGRYMHVLGHRTQTHLVQDYEMNYYRALKEAGYHTAMYGKNDAFSPAAQNLSLSYWESDIGFSSGPQAIPYPEPGAFSFLSEGSNTSGADPAASGDYRGVLRALDFMRNSPPEPFSLFLTSRGAHPPYGAPVEWHNKFSVDDVKASGWSPRGRSIPGMPTYMQNENGIPYYRNLTSLPDEFFYKIQAVYLGMISYTDWVFGQLLDGLAKIEDQHGKMADRTAVFFSSDHGDFGGDYGLVEKWPGSMADVLTRVPLYARIPGGAAGHVSNAPVQTADVLETMLDLGGVLLPNWVRFGKSLVPQLMGGEGQADRYVYAEGGFYFANEQFNEANECLSGCPRAVYCPRGREESQPNGSPRASMIRNATAKLVHRPTGVSELYDLVQDPRETVNFWNKPSHAQLQAELLLALLNWNILTSDVTPEKLDARGGTRFPYPLPPADPWADPAVWTGPSPDDYFAINGVSEQ